MPFLHFQYKPLFLIVVALLLAVSHGTSFINSQTTNIMQNRNVVQFGNMVMSMIGNPLQYNGYGCWCGKGNRGELVVDATDRCCQAHDKCWGSLEENIAGCSPFIKWYSYNKRSNNDIQCNDAIGTCAYGTCLCDKIAVECFAHYRSTSYDSDFDDWEGICTETSKTSQDDPQRCPPVWNSREKYSNGTLVSVNGIIYKSLGSFGLGWNPKSSLVTSQYTGTIAAWKKFGPCRRINEVEEF